MRNVLQPPSFSGKFYITCGHTCGHIKPRRTDMAQHHKTQYPGVTYILVSRLVGSGQERMYYIRYRRGGRGTPEIREPVGRESADWTPRKVAQVREDRARGKEASNVERRHAREMARLAEQAKPTIARLWDAYKDSNPDRNWATDITCYNKYLEPLFSKKIPQEINTRDVESAKLSFIALGKSPQTVKHILGLLRRIMNFAVKKSIIPVEFCNHIVFSMPVVDNKKTENLTEVQMKALLAALDQEADQDATALIRLALYTGMRKGALLALKWEDIDFTRKFITLRGESSKKRKTDFIPISPVVEKILQNITRTESSYVFPGKDGKQRADYRRIARRVKKVAKLPEDFRPLHGLRHTFASWLASSGKVDRYTLQKLLTHESPQMTDRYAHLSDEALQRAARATEEIFSAPEKGKKEEEE